MPRSSRRQLPVEDAPSHLDHHFPLPGDRIGRYEVQAEIGRGSLGRVYRAHDPLTNRTVAIKLMRTAYLPQRAVELYRRRFRMEAQAAGGLAHPNIVRIYDQGDEYLVMEFLDGTLLSRRLRERRMAVDKALRILAGISAALDHAHARGVVHRDVEPRKILLLGDRTPKLTGFGLAVFPGADATVGGKFLAHPAYMAPEHIVEGRATAVSDLFSLGSIAYEMLTGQRCFPGRTVGEVIHRVVYDEPPRVTRLNCRLPPAYDDVFARILDKDPARRLDNAAAFVAALERHRGARRAAPRPSRPQSERRAPPPDPRAQATLELSRRPTTGVPSTGLAIRTEPVGAAVWIDGALLGSTPVAFAPLAPGPHAMRVMAAGFVPVQVTVDCAAGSAGLVIHLQPIPPERPVSVQEGLGDGVGLAAGRPLGRPS
jgi:serine/threonine-protein kinase